ncbi:uncharacterized protein LOC112520989 [Cynara cardunculus var. scolymus]|uniref:uncharacterized protein LOC112520989 n=1 Tax=Cynara cardunculus var. scolymus TaxID=59895 RepID=UPI000D62D1EF|nr:uncharacterized protein LOC112520989 [Cynara cardunculus var. scolymus]
MRLCYGIESVEICDSNVASFCSLGSPISLRLDNLQKLEKICISIGYSWKKINDMFCQISCSVPYLQVLELYLYGLQGARELLPFPNLRKVIQLMISVVERDDDGLFVLTSLVEACPNLKRFSIEVVLHLSLVLN